eukprot:3066633-Pyramimonas_sp.AAC.1
MPTYRTTPNPTRRPEFDPNLARTSGWGGTGSIFFQRSPTPPLEVEGALTASGWVGGLAGGDWSLLRVPRAASEG